MLEKMDSHLALGNAIATPQARSGCSEPRRLTPDEFQQLLRNADRIQENWGTDCDFDDHQGPVPSLDVIVETEILPGENIAPADAEHLLELARAEQRRRNAMRLRSRLDDFTRSVGQRFAAATLENYQVTLPEQRKVIDAITGYVAAIKVRTAGGQGIVLFGNPGTGKTHMLAAAGKDAIRAGLTIVWRNGQEVFASFREAISSNQSESAIVRELVAPDVLIVDDILPPSGVLTEYQASTLYQIIDARYRQCRPTWATMNVADGGEAQRGMGVQIVDRLRDGALTLFCDWPSHRKAAT